MSLSRMDQARERIKAQQIAKFGIDPGGADFDNATQLKRVQDGLMPDEHLYAVYDMKGGGTGFIAITDRRILLQDEGVIRKRRSLVTIPYGQVSLVAAADEGGIISRTSALTILTTGGRQFDMEFRSPDKAERAYAFMLAHLT